MEIIRDFTHREQALPAVLRNFIELRVSYVQLTKLAAICFSFSLAAVISASRIAS